MPFSVKALKISITTLWKVIINYKEQGVSKADNLKKSTCIKASSNCQWG